MSTPGKMDSGGSRETEPGARAGYSGGRLILLANLARRIATDLDPPQIRQDIIDAACELVSAQYGALAIMDESGNVQHFTTHGMSPDVHTRIEENPQGIGLLGLLQTSRLPLRLADIQTHAGSAGFPQHHPVMKTFLGAPIYQGNEHLGSLYLTEKSGDLEFTQEDEELLVMFAALTAMAISHARLYAVESLQRQQAERERARLRAIIDSSAAGIVVVEAPDGRVVLANREAERILGHPLVTGDEKERYETAAVYRKPDGSLYELNELPLQRAISQGITSQGIEVIFDFEDGRSIPTVVNAAPVHDEQGDISAAVAVIGDISALQEVERLKAEFLSMMTHDLRGPLSTIKGLSSSMLMDQTPLDAQMTQEYINTIDEETDRMSELVGNLLDMSRIEANSMAMDPELCHLADITAECVRRIERSREGGQHGILSDVPLDLPVIFADYDQISRVITNLLSNAIKYSPRGSQIQIRSYLDPGNSRSVITEVSDHGIGIPPHEIDKIFDRFYRVTSQRGRGRPGSGLGLSICKAIIEAHEGRIWVDSRPGEGARFYFSLSGAVASVAAK